MSAIRPSLRGCHYCRFKPGQSYTSKVGRSRYSSSRPDEIGPDASQKTRSRIARVNARLPRFLQGYTKSVVNAPITHISAFLLLHELTAVVPLLGLAGIFHYTQWLPPYISEGQWVSAGVEKFGRYFKRKGWLGEEGVARRDRYWGFSEKGVRIIVEVATAWAITKALLPLRLVLSVWATPWFARVAIVPSTNMVKRLFSNKRKVSTAPTAAGAGATAAGVTPKGNTKP